MQIDLRRLDVALLSLLGPARQQDHQQIAVASEIHAVSWSPIDPVFEHALPDPLGVRQVALFEPRQRDSNLRPGRGVEAGEPFFEWAAPRYP